MARAPGTTAGDTAEFVPLPAVSLLQRRPPTCCCSVFPPFGFIRGVKVASVLLLLSYFGLFPVLVSLFLSHCFWRWGIARLFEELPVNRHLGSLESALAVEHRSRHEHYLHFYRIRPLMKECGFL